MLKRNIGTMIGFQLDGITVWAIYQRARRYSSMQAADALA
jgi:hypothetical protein